MPLPTESKPEVSPAPLLQNGGLSRELARTALLVFALVSAWQLAHQLVEILLMFAMVFLLAIILNSIVVTLEKRGVRRGLAVAMIMLSFIGAVVLGGVLIVPPALKQANQLVTKAPTYWKNIRGRISELESKYPSLKQVLPAVTDEKSGDNVVSSRESSVEKSSTVAPDSASESDANAASSNAASEQNAASSTEESSGASGNAATEDAPLPPDDTGAENRASESSASSSTSEKPQTVTRRVTTKKTTTPTQKPEADSPLSGFLQQDALLGYAKSAFTITATVAGAIFVTVLSFLLLMFTLSNPQALVGGVLAVTPGNYREPMRRSLARIFMQMTGWARATVINGTITGVLTGVGLAFAGVQPALIFGICAFFGEFVPTLGPIAAAAPAIFVAFSMGTSKGLAALGVIVLIQAVVSNALNPIIMGREMKLHPASIMFFALMMGKLFGVAGAILAVPSAAIAKILVEEFYLRRQGVSEDEIQAQARGIVMNESGVEEPDD